MPETKPEGPTSDILKELRSDPAKYQGLRDQIEQASSDEDRAQILIDFATNDERLKNMGASQQQLAGTGTITVTTVLTPAGPPRDDA